MVFVLGFFAINQFVFIDRNVKDLYSTMHANDQVMFNFDVENLNWERYCEDIVLGFKQFLPDKTPLKKESS